MCDDFDEAQQGWTLQTVQPGIGGSPSGYQRLIWRSVEDPDQVPYCLSIQANGNISPAFVTLMPCAEVSIQLQYTQTGQVVDAASGLCLTPKSYMWSNGPGFVLAPCETLLTNGNGFADQRFVIGDDPNKLQHLVSSNGQCLTVKSSAPMNANVLQIWAKMLPQSSMSSTGRLSGQRQAVLLLNSDMASNHTVAFSQAVIKGVFGLVSSDEVHVDVFDVWAQSYRQNSTLQFDVESTPRSSSFFVLEISS